MKSLKLLLSVLALAAIAATPSLRAQDASSSTSSSSSSQGQQGGHQRGHFDPAKMEANLKAQIAKLTLTSAQQTTINAAFADWDKQASALQSATTDDQKKPIFAAIKADHKKIMDALTDDQKAQLRQGHKKNQNSGSSSSSSSSTSSN